jgi:glutamate synthase domain-containing protein 3
VAQAVTGSGVEAVTVPGRDRDAREINADIRRALADGARDIVVTDPGAKHNLGVAVLTPCRITFEGSLGYFGCSLGDGIRAHVKGRAGWSLAENMMDGEVVVEGGSGSSTGAGIRGGAVVVHGNAGARTGISQKGGAIVVGGDSGLLTGFMLQKGRIVILGDVGRACGDSMYDGEIFVGGKVASLGTDAVAGEMDELDAEWLTRTLDRYGLEAPDEWSKIVAGRQLYNYDNLEPMERKIAL